MACWTKVLNRRLHAESGRAELLLKCCISRSGPGHGKSGRVPGGYRPEDYCRDILAFLHSKFDQPAAPLGHSAGGMVALWCAAEYSEGVRAVINGDLCASTEKLAALIRDEESMKYYSALRSLARSP